MGPEETESNKSDPHLSWQAQKGIKKRRLSHCADKTAAASPSLHFSPYQSFEEVEAA